MPFKSKAQRDKFVELLAAGKITQEIFDKMQEGTPDELPERLHPKREAIPDGDRKAAHDDDERKRKREERGE